MPHIILGLFFIVIGFLLKKYPMLIAGLNTMSEEEKKNIDIDKLSSALRNIFIATGMVLIVAIPILNYFNLQLLTGGLFIGIPILSALIAIYYGNKYNLNPVNNQWIAMVIVIVIAIILVISIFYGLKESTITISSDKIEFSGIYGKDINTIDIEDVTLINELPRITFKNNGFDLGGRYKGTFTLEEIGICRLYINATKPPYLKIKSKGGLIVIYNSNDSTLTLKHLNDIKGLLAK